MAFRTSRLGILLLAFLALSPAWSAQRTKPPTLNQILRHLEANLNHDDADLPSLFCSEHAASSRIEPGLPALATTTDSIFRLRRTRGPGHSTTLVESREIGTVDGKPAASPQMDAPAMLSGIFEGGLDVVSLDQAPCMDYTLQRISRQNPAQPYIVRFATALNPRNPAACFLQEDSKGRVLIDPASLQVIRLEITTPRHLISAGSAFTSDVIGKRKLTVDYAPVQLGGETFWMPSTITMRTSSGFGFHQIVWSFQATYRNYHRLEVTEHILPATNPQAP